MRRCESHIKRKRSKQSVRCARGHEKVRSPPKRGERRSSHAWTSEKEKKTKRSTIQKVTRGLSNFPLGVGGAAKYSK